MRIKRINLFGASGHAKVILDIIESQKHTKVGHIFDNNKEIRAVQGIPVHHPSETDLLDAYPVLISIGDNGIRKRISEKYKFSAPSFVSHSSSIISPSAFVGDGTVVMPNAVVNASAVVGNNAIINSGAIVEHDCFVDDYAHVSPGAVLAGNVSVGEGTHIGAGASVIPGVKIGKWCKVGAGAVVLRDIPDGMTVVGVPAKPIYSESMI